MYSFLGVFLLDKKWSLEKVPTKLATDYIQILTDEETSEAVGKAKNEGFDDHAKQNSGGVPPQSKVDISCTVEDEHKSLFFDSNQSSNDIMAQAGRNVGLKHAQPGGNTVPILFRTSNTFDSIYQNKYHWSMSHPELFPYGRGNDLLCKLLF